MSLCEKAQAGDNDAFSDLVALFGGRIFSACYSFLGNRQDAEDCVQETFIKAYRAIHDFNFMASFYTWLYRIAMNTCLDYRRKTARRQTFSIDESIEIEDSQVALQFADDKPLPAEQAEQNELCQMIREEISALPPLMRQIIVLRDLEGLSYRELADLLELSEGTVKSRLSRARMQLMQRIKNREKRGTNNHRSASNR
jgi:RNA polymerase sigma-70 factor, ECF subfamily